MIYYTTTKSKFLQVLRERFTYASREQDGCLVYLDSFDCYEKFASILRGNESKEGWIHRYQLEASASTRNRHKKIKPVFDLILYGAVKAGFDRELINFPNFEDLTHNDFAMCSIVVGLVVTFPKDFYRIKAGETALFDLSNTTHIEHLNKKIKKLIPHAEKFRSIDNVVIFKNYVMEKRKPKITRQHADKQYKRYLKNWEEAFARAPETAGKKPKKSTPSQHEWTICLSEHAKTTIADALNQGVHLYEKHGDAGQIFLNHMDRTHRFITKYNGHRGVRSDIGVEYVNFRKNFATKIKHITLDEALKGHTLNLKYMGQLKDEYKNWGGNVFHRQDNLELMLLRAQESYHFGYGYNGDFD